MAQCCKDYAKSCTYLCRQRYGVYDPAHYLQREVVGKLGASHDTLMIEGVVQDGVGVVVHAGLEELFTLFLLLLAGAEEPGNSRDM